MSRRPAHLLSAEFGSWDALLLAAVDATIEAMLELGPRLADRTWGERNSPAIQHPISQALRDMNEPTRSRQIAFR